MSFSDDAVAAFRGGDLNRVRTLSERALDAARAEGDIAAEVEALCWLSRVALREGDFERVGGLADKAMELARSTEEARLQRIPLHMQAVARRMKGDFKRARELYQASIHLNQTLQEERMVAGEFRNLAYVELHDGRPQEARRLFLECRSEARRLGYKPLRPYLLADAAVIAAEDRNPERAAQLLGAAQAAFRALNQIPDPDDASEQDRLAEKLIRLLGEEGYREASATGASSAADEELNGEA